MASRHAQCYAPEATALGKTRRRGKRGAFVMPLFITQGRAHRADCSAMNLHRWLAKVLVILVLGVASTLLVVSSLVAAPVTYTQEATASGSLGGVGFTNADVVLSMTNDTANVIRNGQIFSNAGMATVTVASNPPTTFAHSI
jgi:hypothetical protein